MKNYKKLNINAVEMVRKIRDDNFKIFKNKNRNERLAWFHEQAKNANKILAEG